MILNDVKYEKLLGVTIDNCLVSCQQINNIVSKISSRLGLMCRLRTYLPTKGYNGYILPLFDYWETTNLNLETLCRLQNRATRIILNAKYDIPSLQLFKKLGWLSIQNRLEYHKSVLMYTCINNSASDYLVNLFDMNTNSNVYSLRSSIKGNLFVPRLNSNLFITPELF